ncbi:Unknown protein sequence [Pseudomonas amygdali pv. lachrymans]|uniref:Uncharacterized protein n=1 Tax=Pseudomonas amygdali pv. lachrymans TaxID=53707 RepID=A0ABR5KTD1_PSEAV|nr:Unknown protein sequence [Pseudomonas amygdali pv. lachrymans]KPC18095.1 Unknown protein sequence [Pseudomonas amygdali pv. lachrymans]
MQEFLAIVPPAVLECSNPKNTFPCSLLGQLKDKGFQCYWHIDGADFG